MNDRRTLIASAIGAASGAAGLAASAACAGAACLSCFGCAAAGAGVLVAALVGAKRNASREHRHAPATVGGDRHGLA